MPSAVYLKTELRFVRDEDLEEFYKEDLERMADSIALINREIAATYTRLAIVILGGLALALIFGIGLLA